MHMRKMRSTGDAFGAQPLWVRLVIATLSVLIVAGAIIVPHAIASQAHIFTEDVRSRYAVGSLAESDVRATETFHYIDEGETRRRQRLAADAVLPKFTFSTVDFSAMFATLELLFSDTPSQNADQLEHSIASLDERERASLYVLLHELVSRYASLGIFRRADISEIAGEGNVRVSIVREPVYGGRRTVAERDVSSLLSLEVVLTRASEDVTALGRLAGLANGQLAREALERILRPNVFYAPMETELEREQAAQAIDPVIVRVEKGQYILKKDFVITSEDLKALQAMRLAGVSYSASQMIGRIGFVLIITVCAIIAMVSAFSRSKRLWQYLLLFLSGVGFTQVMTFVVLSVVSGRGYISLDPFLPLFLLPILLSLLTNRKRAGMIAAILIGSYALLLPSSTGTTFFLVVAISSSGIYFIRYVTKRIDMIFQWFFGIVSAACFVLINNLFNGYGFHHVLQSITAVIANISITYVLVTLLLPLLEWAGNFPTSFRLRELAFSDAPVLVRLSQTAMGTYNHSMMVAEMAYAAANEIGSDALLARVGGMYHDIGKQEHPEYFIENQSGDNKHDELKASLSVAIIKSHVKIGVEKGREARLPQEVLDIISQHHGNDVIAVFLKEAQDAAAAGGTLSPVKQQDYSYQNQIPQTPEAAIVMLADSVEAASRTIRKPSAQKYEKLVNQIFMGKIDRKQLGSSRLSMTDLDEIARTFVQILTGRYHSRIEYPNERQEVES